MQAQLKKTVLMPNIKSGICHTNNHGRVEWMDEGDSEWSQIENRKYLGGFFCWIRLWLLQGAEPCGRAT